MILEAIGIGKDFLSSSKKKDPQMGLPEIKKLLHYKRNGL
jgi:hypothetical protein